jgi:uncharacterized protein (DUF1800 family)
VKIDRRKFIQTGSAATLTATVGCDQALQFVQFGRAVPAPPEPPFLAPSEKDIDLVSHGLNRLTFGPRPWDYQRARSLGKTTEEALDAFVEEQLLADKIDDPAGENAIRRLETLSLSTGELFEYQEDLLLDELTQGTLLRAVLSERQLYEVMVQFWSDHFNIDPSKGDCKWLKTADDREVIRKHALGNFPEMLRASAQSPAMLWYLDGRVNRSRNDEEKPNENYARELLELHSLGVEGGYTQQDVMEVARCLTGWTIRESRRSKFGIGTIEFKPHLHDRGDKLVLGQTVKGFSEKLNWDEQRRRGQAELESVLEIIALHPSTARYLATKLCRRFIADEPPAEAIEAVAKTFHDSDGYIPAMLRTLFRTPEFRQTRGNKFKRPFNFVVSALRAAHAETDGGRRITDYLVRMGHAPFQYPTPDGYPEEANPWLGTLLWRWNFAVALSEGRLKGTRVDVAKLRSSFATKLDGAAHLLGRRLDKQEAAAAKAVDNPLALLLSSPGFQMC